MLLEARARPCSMCGMRKHGHPAPRARDRPCQPLQSQPRAPPAAKASVVIVVTCSEHVTENSAKNGAWGKPSQKPSFARYQQSCPVGVSIIERRAFLRPRAVWLWQSPQAGSRKASCRHGPGHSGRAPAEGAHGDPIHRRTEHRARRVCAEAHRHLPGCARSPPRGLPAVAVAHAGGGAGGPAGAAGARGGHARGGAPGRGRHRPAAAAAAGGGRRLGGAACGSGRG